MSEWGHLGPLPAPSEYGWNYTTTKYTVIDSKTSLTDPSHNNSNDLFLHYPYPWLWKNQIDRWKIYGARGIKYLEVRKSQYPFLIGKFWKSRLSFSSPNGITFLKPYVKTENTVFKPAVLDL